MKNDQLINGSNTLSGANVNQSWFFMLLTLKKFAWLESGFLLMFNQSFKTYSNKG